MSNEIPRGVIALVGETPLTYVDCGARAAKAPSWLLPLKASLRYVGIDADAAECERLNRTARPGHRYICAVLDRIAQQRMLYITKNPACSSLLPPDPLAMRAFTTIPDFLELDRQLGVQTTTLETCLQEGGITSVDFLELDTQGNELDVLAGCGRFLRESVLGVQVEVEFEPMYHSQPLFADVDIFMRASGFRLFDLARYHARRDGVSAEVPTRGQLLWGHALYLRDHRASLPVMLAVRLAVIATLLRMPDVAADVLASVPADTLPTALGPAVLRARRQLAACSPDRRLPHLLARLNASGGSKMVRWLGEGGAALRDAYDTAVTHRRYAWRD
jgi:FkbM family methyltransferase